MRKMITEIILKIHRYICNRGQQKPKVRGNEMAIIHSGHNVRYKYEVQIKPCVERMKITNRYNLSRKLFNELKDMGIVQRNFGAFNVFSRYSLNIKNLQMAADSAACLSAIIEMGKIRVPSNLSYKNNVEAIVGSLCKESRTINTKYDRDVDLLEMN